MQQGIAKKMKIHHWIPIILLTGQLNAQITLLSQDLDTEASSNMTTGSTTQDQIVDDDSSETISEGAAGGVSVLARGKSVVNASPTQLQVTSDALAESRSVTDEAGFTDSRAQTFAGIQVDSPVVANISLRMFFSIARLDNPPLFITGDGVSSFEFAGVSFDSNFDGKLILYPEAYGIAAESTAVAETHGGVNTSMHSFVDFNLSVVSEARPLRGKSVGVDPSGEDVTLAFTGEPFAAAQIVHSDTLTFAGAPLVTPTEVVAGTYDSVEKMFYFDAQGDLQIVVDKPTHERQFYRVNPKPSFVADVR